MDMLNVPAWTVDEGDVVVVSNPSDIRVVQDTRETGRGDGIWLEFEDGSSLYFLYDDRVYLRKPE